MRRRDVLVGAGAAAVVFGAVPAVLAVAAGWPLPRHFDRAALLSGRGLFDALAWVAWLAWAACAWPLVRGVAKRVRSRDIVAWPGDGLLDRVALRIAVAILALAPAVGTASAAGAAGSGPPGHGTPAAVVALGRVSPKVVPSTVPAAPPPTTAVPTTVVPTTAVPVRARSTTAPASGPADVGPTSGPAARPTGPAPAGSTTRTGGSAGPAVAAPWQPTWTVQSGDSLWSIAAAVYGDGAQWPRIAQANLGRVMDGGGTFSDPSLILPGWELSVPAVTGPVTTVTTVTTSSVAETDDVASPGGTRTETPPPDPMAGSAHSSPTVMAAGGGRRGTPAHRGAGAAPNHDPEIAIAGLGLLLAALFARRIRRERRLASFLRGEGQRTAPPGPAVAALATSVDGLADLALVELIESAWCRLGAAGAHHPDVDGQGVPGVHLVRVTPAGVELRGVADHWRCPEGWRRTGPSTWWFDAPGPNRVGESRFAGATPWRALLLPLGENDDGEWLVALDAGARLSVLGPAAHDLLGAMAAAARSWSWHEDVVVTATATLAADHFEAYAPTGAGDPAATGVLFTGDPRVLAPGVGERCATLTAEPVASQLVVVVDERGATVHPLGLVLRPHRLGPAGARAVGQLLGETPHGARRQPDPTPLTPDTRPPALVMADERVTARLGAPVTDSHETPVPLITRARRPFVRLLTPVARIDSLGAPIDPKRVRRAVELVAYLGVWHPQPVTGERLRTRVLGTADADAAAKTLFNTAGAARRALGFDDNREPLLPLASRSGHYRLSPEVTVDAVRAATLLADGIAEADGAAGAALVAEGLSLVEGEPLGSSLNGYGWWRGEGHERRLSDLVVDGACRLARRSVETGELDRARWAVDRARLVEPYSEALSRAAMVVAAATGDAGRLQREWDDCRRLMDELDPGGVPSDGTERLYDQLRRQLAEGRSVGTGH